MDTRAVIKTNKIQATAVRTMVGIKADASGNLPTRLELVKAGTWVNSWKGNLQITVNDLVEMMANLQAGVGLPANGSEGAPIDYSHEDWKKAAGWMKAFEVVGDTLYATEIEWTPAGGQAIKDGEFKFFSPSFYPSCLGMWCDPEDPTITATNVVLGGGLTNQPFFKGLTGLKASQSDGGENSQSLIFVSASQERNYMTKTLEEIRKTPVGEHTEEDKTVLKENIKDLTADEQVAFGLVEKQEEKKEEPKTLTETLKPTTEETVVPADAVAIQASINAGTHKLVATAEIESLKASVNANAETIKGYERERIDASVKTHVARGAIKADQAKVWGDKIEADATMSDLLKSLPDNQILASEMGDAGEAGLTATEALDRKAKEAVKASEGKVKYADALITARRDNPDLATAANTESEQ